jgi:hypothetical protein
MQFINPSYLWALLGLIVPIAIHLWSKKQGRTIKVGSVRFLKASNTQKTKSVQLNELLLLVLRLLIVGILVMIMVEVNWKKSSQNSPITYIIEASVLNSPDVKSLADTWLDNAEVRLLQTDFPEYSGEAIDTNNLKTPYYWQLAKEMQDLPTDSIVVLTKSLLKGIKGKRPELADNIKWIVKDVDSNVRERIAGLQKTDAVEWISVNSNATHLKFEKELKPITSIENDSPPLLKIDTIHVYVFSEPEFVAEERYIKASFKALKIYLDYPIQINPINTIDDLKLSSHDILVWLSEKSLPDIEGKVLQYKANAFAQDLIEPVNPGQTYQLTQRLNSENSIREHLAEELIEILNPYSKLKSMASVYDQRTMPLEVLRPTFNSDLSVKSKRVTESSSVYFWIILMLLLVIERIITRYRKQ